MTHKYIIILALCCTIFSCTKNDFSYPDNDLIDLDSISGIKLKLNHYNLLADGKAELEIKPILFKTKDSIIVLNDRVNSDWIKYHTLSEEKVSRYFTTSDESLIGDTIRVYATIEDKVSDTVSFIVKSPLKDDDYKEITFPVIFHICQSKNDIASYGGPIPSDKITNLIERMNKVFSGSISKNPIGVDTKIRFKLALYNPDGELLDEPGINRIVSDTVINDKNKYINFIQANKIDWPFSKYLNIWLLSDNEEAYRYFSYDITRKCIPNSIYTGTDITDKPEGLKFEEIDISSWEPEPNNFGIKYKAQLLNQFKFSIGTRYDNDFMFYLGKYFGLLITHKASSWGKIPNDYCDDTFAYKISSRYYKSNKTMIKETDGGYRFLSENIMDDQTGLHRSISKDQAIRIRWIVKNCPGRSAWKSDFAFTGIE